MAFLTDFVKYRQKLHEFVFLVHGKEINIFCKNDNFQENENPSIKDLFCKRQRNNTIMNRPYP